MPNSKTFLPKQLVSLPTVRREVERLRRDPLALGILVLTVLLLAGLALWLFRTYSTLPDLLPLHFDADGNADRIAERREIFVLPTIAFVVALVNLSAGLLLRLRFGMVFASYLLWGGALLVQLLFWLAAWNITR